MAASGRSHGTFGAYVGVVTADSTTRSSMHGEIHRQSKTLSMLKLPSPAGDGPHASQRGLRSIRPTRQTHPDLADVSADRIRMRMRSRAYLLARFTPTSSVPARPRRRSAMTRPRRERRRRGVAHSAPKVTGHFLGGSYGTVCRQRQRCGAQRAERRRSRFRFRDGRQGPIAVGVGGWC
jgi:hypothetical protein